MSGQNKVVTADKSLIVAAYHVSYPVVAHLYRLAIFAQHPEKVKIRYF
jgi:hypothetical protein